MKTWTHAILIALALAFSSGCAAQMCDTEDECLDEAPLIEACEDEQDEECEEPEAEPLWGGWGGGAPKPPPPGW